MEFQPLPGGSMLRHPLSAELEKSAHVRPLTLADVAAVGELFQKTFRDPNVPAPRSLTDYLQQLFLEHPRQDPDICSRVYVDAEDRIAGFIGVLPLAMESNGRHATRGGCKLAHG